MFWRSLVWCALAALPLGSGCSFDPSGGATSDDDDDIVVVPDAATGIDASVKFDAPPGTPDAPPGTPDAPPGAPDAAGDSDEDGILDADDNCPLIPNADQFDEEPDGVGDVCDNCPSIDNPGQEDVLEGQGDGVGDACDPRPTADGDSIGLFDGFNAMRGDWTVGAGTSTWSASGGVISQTDDSGTSGNVRLLYWAGDTFGDAVVETTVVIDGFSGAFSTPYRTAGVAASYTPGDNTGYGCVQVRENGVGGPSYDASVLRIDGGAVFIDTNVLDWTMNTTDRVRTTLYTKDGGGSQVCALHNLDAGVTSGAQSFDTEFNASRIGLRTFRVSASFEYVVVYSLGGPLP